MSAEVAPGIHRIESILGPRPFSQYLVRDERTLLIDTGVRETPAEVIAPYLDSVGVDAAELDLVVLSHADVDHFGGNAEVRRLAPRALLCAHAADVPWIEDADRIMRERYGWYAEHGVGYEPDVAAWLRGAMGEPVPVDLALQGGEVLRLGAKLALHVLHLPGHSPGHIGLWEPRSRSAIVVDAVLARGLLDTEGNVIHPPPYLDIAGYEASARTLLALRPARLLTAHYAVIEGDAVERFLLETLEFVADTRAATEEILAGEQELTLARALALADQRLGPFTSMPNELAGPVRAHLRELVAAGRAVEAPDRKSWRRVS
ncbi:MAG: MBL fold metallo-hydrolase [Gaiellales bacterium]